MAASGSSDLGRSTVGSSTASPTTTTLPISGWLPAIPDAKIRATLELRGRMGNLEAQFGYQTADVVTSPDAAVGVGSFLGHDVAVNLFWVWGESGTGASVRYRGGTLDL